MSILEMVTYKSFADERRAINDNLSEDRWLENISPPTPVSSLILNAYAIAFSALT